MIVLGVVLLILGLVVAHFAPSGTIAKVGNLVAVIGGILLIVGLVLLLAGASATCCTTLLVPPRFVRAALSFALRRGAAWETWKGTWGAR